MALFLKQRVSTLYAAGAFALLAVGCLIRLYFYIYHKDLWLDEAALFHAAFSAGYAQILHGALGYGQSAPLGFVSAAKFLMNIFGISEYVLYSIPCVSGIALLVVSFNFAKKEFNYIFSVIYISILITSFPLIYYSSEFKQYSTECLISIIYIYLYLKYFEQLYAGNIPFLITGFICLSLLFSTPSIFILSGIAISLMVYWLKNKHFITSLRKNFPSLLLICIFTASYWYFYLKNSSAGMYDYWEKYFMPTNIDKIIPYVKEVIIPLATAFLGISSQSKINLLYIPAFMGGAFFIYRDNQKILLPIFFSCMAVFLAFAARVYPLGHEGLIGTRLTLFYAPVFFILPAYFFYKLITLFLIRLPKHKTAAQIVILLILIVYAADKNISYVKIGTAHEQISSLIRYINTKYNEKSIIAVYGDSLYAYSYYQLIYKRRHEFVLLGHEKMDQTILQVLEKAALQKKEKIFIIFSHCPQQKLSGYIELVEKKYSLLKMMQDKGGTLLVVRPQPAKSPAVPQDG